MNVPSGLSSAEVLERRARGDGNNVEFATSRSYIDIIRTNVLDFINIVLLVLGTVLLLIGRHTDAVLTTTMVIGNALVGIVQEVRAKRKLEQIELLTRPHVAVLRDGQEFDVDPVELVKGDILVIRTGDQAVVDGLVLEGGNLEMDESLLTGEPDRVRKLAGDVVYSGSFCVSGLAYVQAERVGANSYANKLTASARTFRAQLTPLQREIRTVVRLLLLVGMFMSMTFYMANWNDPVPLVRRVQTYVAFASIVPTGVFITIIIAYALGALRMANRGALVQQSNAIEALSHVDVLCLDKTGTLTTNQLRYLDLWPVPLTGLPESFTRSALWYAGPEPQLAGALPLLEPMGGATAPVAEVAVPSIAPAALAQLVGDFSASTTVPNQTSETLASALNGRPHPLVEDVPFSSTRRWSGVVFAGIAANAEQDGQRAMTSDGEQSSGYVGAYVLGALEMLQPYLVGDADLLAQAADWSAEGLRVLLLAANPEVMRLRDDAGDPRLPPLIPLALVALEDQLRPNVREVVAHFVEAGVTLKVISGDNPTAVASLAKRAGIAGAEYAVSGAELDGLSTAELNEVLQAATVFGRISPEQKQRLIKALRDQGHYVAMIGDGVNDVLPLKQADVGVAMESGSSAARGVADIVLLNDSFDALAHALDQGQRIVNGLIDSFSLFLTRTSTLALLIMPLAVIAGAIPALPAQTTVWTLLTSGVPALFLTARAPAGHIPGRSKSLLSLVAFVGPAAVTMATFGLLIFTALHVLAVQSLATVIAMEPDVLQELTLWLEDALGYPVVGRITVYTLFSEWIGRTGLLSFEIFAGIALVLFVAPPHPFFAVMRPLRKDKSPAIVVALLFMVALFVMFSPWTLERLTLAHLREIHIFALLATVVWVIVIRSIWKYRLFQKFLGLHEPENEIPAGPEVAIEQK
jgi:cation-transporting P-type ATPase E